VGSALFTGTLIKMIFNALYQTQVEAQGGLCVFFCFGRFFLEKVALER
jgi:hypothetical protein